MGMRRLRAEEQLARSHLASVYKGGLCVHALWAIDTYEEKEMAASVEFDVVENCYHGSGMAQTLVFEVGHLGAAEEVDLQLRFHGELRECAEDDRAYAHLRLYGPG